MGRAENRHYTQKWKKKRENHDSDKCSRRKYTICHSEKVLGIDKAKYKNIEDVDF